MSVERAADHYDRVTEAWMKWIMGDDLHFGVFSSAREPLAEATRNLTLRLAACADLSPELEVLDVGCGVGTQAIELALHEQCRVTGISTSAVGLEMARARAVEQGCADRTRFELRDAMNTGLASESFDRVFSLES